MTRTWGWILTIVGLLIACAGLWLALRPVLGLYGTALDDPLAPGASDDGKKILREVVPGLAVAFVGLVVGLAGKVLLGVAYYKRLRRRSTTH